MTSEIQDRIKLFCSVSGVSVRSFCLSIGVSAGYVNNISKSIQPDKLQRISAKYPELNIGWLLTGNGEMLNNQHSSGQTIIGNNIIGSNNTSTNKGSIENRQYYGNAANEVWQAKAEMLKERITEKDAQIERLNRIITEKDAQIQSLLSILEKR